MYLCFLLELEDRGVKREKKGRSEEGKAEEGRIELNFHHK